VTRIVIRGGENREDFRRPLAEMFDQAVPADPYAP
jgi:hypothetical protein